MKKFCIVIPIYKTNLDCIEKVSLMQLWNTIGGKHYHIYFVRPDTPYFDMTAYYDLLPGWGDNVYEEAFDENYFKSTATYSQLCISYDFYNRFSDYEYMYIYQLDCILTCDRLEKFCEFGFDYIGAPILSTDCAWPTVNKTTGKYTPAVGNGGFSLRKISTFKDITNPNGEFIQHYNITPDMLKTVKFEDLYFCTYVNDRYYINIAPFQYSVIFAWDMNVDIIYNHWNFHKMPMCIHAWDKNIRFWKDHLPYITQDIVYYCEQKHEEFFSIYYDENNSSAR